MHIIADATMGLGIQGILLAYHCLFKGLQYHTAARSKSRAERQRKALQLRQALKYVEQDKGHPEISSPSAVEEYYKEFGDIDGSAFTSHLRLPSDPCADGWVDFILPAGCVWFIGVFCAVLSAYCRWYSAGSDLQENHAVDGIIGNESRVDVVYKLSSTAEVFIILIWIHLILAAIVDTGEKLKKEPFLGTRPAQLAFRILFAHTALAMTALVVSFLLYVRQLETDWHGQTIEISVEQSDKEFPVLILRALHDVVTRFPYSGTATTVGFGRLLCVSIEVLITAFIFLPAHAMDSSDTDELEEHAGRELRLRNKNKRDKRLVVHLAKESRTWRIFPCPIQRMNDLNSPLQDNMYQLYKDLHTDTNIQRRGIVSIGPYTPVFCAEIACWLNEASWQAYYSPPGALDMMHKDDFEGWMNLESIGLQLEGYVYDDRTNAQAYIATNFAPQVDGEEDSIVVVAFRGTSNVTHMQIDLRMRQVRGLSRRQGLSDKPFWCYSRSCNHKYYDYYRSLW
jgi:hypothetical protein